MVAWRLSPEGGGTLTPWLPEVDGRWHSAWGFALGVQGLLVRVYTPEGVAVSTGHEHSLLRQQAEAALREEARRRQEAEQRAAALEAELRRLRGETP